MTSYDPSPQTKIVESHVKVVRVIYTVLDWVFAKNNNFLWLLFW